MGFFDGIKRLFTRGRDGDALADIETWARDEQFRFRALRGEAPGFVIDGQLGIQPWRLDWGPSQHPCIDGSELRLRADLNLSASLQALVLDRPLQAQLTQRMVDLYVDPAPSPVEHPAPPEMRWLVMHDELSGTDLGALRERFAGVSPDKAWLKSWLEGPLTMGLLAAPLVAGQPMLLMLSQSRLTLRTGFTAPRHQDLETWVHVFQVAIRAARRAADAEPDLGHASTQPSMFTTSLGDDTRP